MTWLERFRLYLRLFTFTRGGFERQVRTLLENRERIADWDRRFLESEQFLAYWREEFRHTWRAVSQEGTLELGRMRKHEALEYLARIQPHASVHWLDEVNHYVLFTNRPGA